MIEIMSSGCVRLFVQSHLQLRAAPASGRRLRATSRSHGDLPKRAIQSDSAPIVAGFRDEEGENPLARRADIAQRHSRAQRHHLPGEIGAQVEPRRRIVVQPSETGRLGKASHDCINEGDCVAMVVLGEERGLGETFAGPAVNRAVSRPSVPKRTSLTRPSRTRKKPRVSSPAANSVSPAARRRMTGSISENRSALDPLSRVLAMPDDPGR